ncbi:MAG: hypothetical protein AVDCRST_MAG89-1852 [uncultured Gemmatimonadetes bacterium]|uniref:Uncharacterized protein n=1 Tax=uncultured Gemmatimonadota bacterium TaxID=203437 RepID=A0A6J4L7N2_9BACT|nr:MAG: hypothetical protein AVDCRST_MAG89-1852 [uncultured Gemmatimonadota bacterium]
MRQPPRNDDLPDGVVKLPPEPVPHRKPPGGCGLTGCLYGTMILFALLLMVMVGLALFRQWQVPTLPYPGR